MGSEDSTCLSDKPIANSLLQFPEMAARVTTSVVDFAALASKIPSSQAGSFSALRGKVEKHLRNVSALPAALPNIDFAAYNKVSVPGMVETFETKYKALQVPYPSDQGSLQAIDDQAKEQEAAYKQFCADSSKNIADI